MEHHGLNIFPGRLANNFRIASGVPKTSKLHSEPFLTANQHLGQRMQGVYIPRTTSSQPTTELTMANQPMQATGQSELVKKKMARHQQWLRLKQDPVRYARWKAETRERMRQMYARKKAAKEQQQLKHLQEFPF